MDEMFAVIKCAKDASNLSGLAFEEYLRQLFESLGYSAEKTKASGDYGGDLILSLGDKRIVVQAKQYKNNVGLEAIKEAHFAKSYYDADEAWVVTTSSFTPQAVSGAKDTGVRLVDGQELSDLISTARRREGSVETSIEEGVTFGRRKSGFVTSETEEGYEGDIVLVQYQGTASKVHLPEGIEVLGSGAFANANIAERFELSKPFCDAGALVEVALPKGLRVIGDSCFSGCNNLQSMNPVHSLEAVGNRAFMNCGFRSVILRPCIRYGQGVYSWNHSLRSVIVEDSTTVIPTRCFSHCEQLSHVELAPTVENIGNDAFSHCTALKSLVVPEGVTYIGSHAFYNCAALTEVYLPTTLRSISVDAFDGCPILRDSFIGDIFDLTGVQLVDWNRSKLYRSEDSLINVSEEDARADYEIHRWKTEWLSAHRNKPYVSEIEALEIDASYVQALEDAINEYVHKEGRNGIFSYEMYKSVRQRIDARTEILTETLCEMGLNERLSLRFGDIAISIHPPSSKAGHAASPGTMSAKRS